ncbi:MAG: thermonuclease family protein [Phycisphaeraceae bacterium]
MRTRAVRRIVVVIVAVIALSALSWADHHGWLLYQGSDWRRYDGQSFVVTRVIDGDTIEVDAPDGGRATTRVRLWGIDTPEKADPRAGRSAEPFADAATEFTRQQCEQKTVRLMLESHRMRGRFNRIVAYVELPDGLLLNERLLAAGLARADDRFDHRMLERFNLIAVQAKRDKVGLWGDVEGRIPNVE